MSSFRFPRNAIRCLQPLTKPRSTHTRGTAFRVPQRSLARICWTPPAQHLIPSRRLYSQLTSEGAKATSEEAKDSEDRWANTPAYEMTFTCKQCHTRSSHKISKQGYHHGTVLITCPGCKNRHLISDHMKIFSDKRITLDDIMKEKGQLVKRGTLSSEGDVEFWDDGTEVKRDA